jgi:PST family polysaccharide transporter
MLSQSAAFLAQFVATVVLTRLLAPSDFGLVTMVTTFSLLLASFGLNGFTEAILQRPEIDDPLASNLFWINLGGGTLLSLGFAAAGSLIAGFYREPKVANVAIGLSFTIFFTSTSVLHLALLKRGMKFSALAVNDIVARVVSVVVSIALAVAGFGVWALVAGAVALPLSQSIGAWTLCRWFPKLPRRVPGTMSVVVFAINTYLHCIVNYFTKNTDNLLVGWRFSAQALGFYKKAYDLFALPANQLLSPISAVVLTTLSRLQDNRAEYQRCFLRGLSILAFVGMAISGELTLIGKDFIRVLLGPGWDAAGRIFVFFGPGIGFMLIYGTHSWLHLSSGRADRWFRWGIVEFSVTVLLFLLALPWGPLGIAAAWTLSFWILMLPAFWYAGKPIGFGIAPLLSVLWKYALAAAAAGCTAAVIISRMHQLLAFPDWMGALVRIVIVSLLFLGLYLLAVVFLHGGSEPIRQITRLVPDLLPWRASRAPAAATLPRERIAELS